MKKNKIYSFSYFFKSFLIILTFVINGCGEDGGGSQQIKNLKQTQLSIADDENILSDFIKDCGDVKFTVEDFTNNNLIDAKYKFLSLKNYHDEDEDIIVVYGKLNVGDDRKVNRNIRKEYGGDLYYSAVFVSSSGAVDTWRGEGDIFSSEQLFNEDDRAIAETKEDLLEEGVSEAKVKKFSVDKTKFIVNKVKPGLDFVAIGFLQFRFAGLANNDLKLCLQDDDEYGIFTDEFFKTGILKD